MSGLLYDIIYVYLKYYNCCAKVMNVLNIGLSLIYTHTPIHLHISMKLGYKYYVLSNKPIKIKNGETADTVLYIEIVNVLMTKNETFLVNKKEIYLIFCEIF